MTPAVAGERPRLLYIDDDAGLRHLVNRTLGRRGFDVSTAADGVQGVALAASQTYDVVAVDHYMPGQDGLTTLKQLRALPDVPPIVYVTGSDESRIAVAALKAGAADYVVKSGEEDFQDLLANAIGQAVDQARLRRERDVAQHALGEANARLEAVVAHQAVLLREVNHRVANSLQLIASMVHMQSAAVEDPAARSALRDTEARIAAIMQVHRRLYTSDDVQTVDVADYLGGLVTELEQSLTAAGDHRPIHLSAAPVRLNTDKAVSLGVIVAELVANAFKYAYGAGQPGEVRVRLDTGADAALKLVVEDDGCGLDGQSARGTGLGQRVIAAMAQSLGSKVQYDTGHRGCRAVLAFDP